MKLVITANQLAVVLAGSENKESKEILDLGLTPVTILKKKDVVFFNETEIPVKQLKKIRLEKAITI